MGQEIPLEACEIDAGWLEEALAERHPGVRVAEATLLESHEATNAHARLSVRYREAAGAPETLFCKLLPSESARRQAIAGTGMGLREALFYERLAPQLAMRVPEIHGLRYDEEDGAFVILMEDLVAGHCTISKGPQSVGVDAAAGALEDLAQLHVRFEDPVRRKREAGWVREPDRPTDYATTRLRYALEQRRERLTDVFAELAQLYIEKRDALHALWHPGPMTVIHGDAHIGNLFDDGGRTGFLDWGIINVSTPLRDVSYFMTMSMDVDDRRENEVKLLRHYLDLRVSLGGSAIDFDTAWLAHRVQSAYTVPASCQVVTFPEDASPRRRVFADAFLARAEAALADLEVRAALREVGL
jgi:aminoglycoside phosphotransferase (APT) family kinase protein